MRRLPAIRAALAMTTLFIAAVAQSEPKLSAPRPVKLAVDGVHQMRNLPILVAQRLHYFEDAGLLVTLIDAPANPTPDQLIANGRADGAVAFFHHTFMTQTDQGVVSQAVVIMGASPQLKLVIASRLAGKIRSIDDLRGRRIYVGGGNSGKTTTMNWLVTRAGLPIDSYTALKPTTPTAMAGALRDGSVDAIIAHEPDVSYYVASGAGTLLADINSIAGTRSSLGEIYPSTSLYLPKAFIDAHPETVRALVTACLHAMDFIKHHSPQQIAEVLPARRSDIDEKAYLAMIASDKQAFETDGRVTLSAARKLLNLMTALAPKYSKVDVSRTFTNKFVDDAMASTHRRSN